ncbi:hypothetical protein D3C86_1449220 [compost metagenome]
MLVDLQDIQDHEIRLKLRQGKLPHGWVVLSSEGETWEAGLLEQAQTCRIFEGHDRDVTPTSFHGRGHSLGAEDMAEPNLPRTIGPEEDPFAR